MSFEMIPFFMMNGNAKEAIAYYQQVLDAKVVFIQENKNRVEHAVLNIGDSPIMLSDTIEQIPFQQGTQVNICITIDDRQRAEKVYATLQKEGQTLLPMQEMPFSPAYGIVKDKFGICFQVAAQVNKHH
jgi:PhnB protein